MAPEAPVHELLLALAAERLALGDLAMADMAAREALDISPGDLRAIRIIDRITDALGLRGRAPPPPPDGRHLLIKGWGYGFWSEVEHVLAGLLLAEATGRIPVVHWGRNSLFTDDPEADAFTRFFEPVSDVGLDDLIAARPASLFPARWTLENLREEDLDKCEAAGLRAVYLLGRPEALAVSDFHNHVIDVLPWLPPSHPLRGRPVAEAHPWLIGRYLRPNREILAAVDAFAAARLTGRPFIAVHARGSDKREEDPYLDEVNRRYFDILDREDPAWGIFLLSEDQRLVEAFRARYGERVVVTEAQRTDNAEAPHHRADIDRARLGREVMVDTYLALRCERFLGNGRSNLSAMVAELKAWPPGACTLIGPSALRWRWVRTLFETPEEA